MDKLRAAGVGESTAKKAKQLMGVCSVKQGAMRATLPEMQVTNSLQDVVDFICQVKGSGYFKEGKP